MSSWRRFFLIVLLVLSLPVQSYAAVQAICVAHEQAGDSAGADAQDQAAQAEPEAHDMHAVAFMGDSHRHVNHGNTHNAHSCTACVSCCLGAGLPTASALPVFAEPAGAAHALLSRTPVTSFLTGGIERPPRSLLV